MWSQPRKESNRYSLWYIPRILQCGKELVGSTKNKHFGNQLMGQTTAVPQGGMVLYVPLTVLYICCRHCTHIEVQNVPFRDLPTHSSHRMHCECTDAVRPFERTSSLPSAQWTLPSTSPVHKHETAAINPRWSHQVWFSFIDRNL